MPPRAGKVSGFATLLAFNQGFVWTRSPLRAQEGGRGAWGRIREEFLCLLSRGQGFKGSSRTQPWLGFRPPGMGCKDRVGAWVHPAALRAAVPSSLGDASTGCWDQGCLSPISQMKRIPLGDAPALQHTEHHSRSWAGVFLM